MTRGRLEAGSGIKALQVQSLAEAAAQTLRDAIIIGKLKPGERLVEQKLAAQLAIGQPTLREALKELEHQGFVRKVANRGSYITDLTKEDFEKIHQVRMILESVAVEQAATRMTPPTLRELEATVETMDSAARKDDRTAFHKADLDFHRAIWTMSGNEYLSSALERLIFSLFAFVLLGQEQSEFIAAVGQHRDILEGLRSADSLQARAAFIRSTNRFWQEYHHVTALQL
jgi:DNA-binding GntR family transcriptional regulator